MWYQCKGLVEMGICSCQNLCLNKASIYVFSISIPFLFISSSQSLFQSFSFFPLSWSPIISLSCRIFLLIQSLIHTQSCIQHRLPLIYPLSISFTPLPVNSALPLTLQSGSLVLPLERFGLSPLFLSDQSSFGYCSRAEFRLGLSRLWREFFINPQLPCCWFSWPV